MREFLTGESWERFDATLGRATRIYEDARLLLVARIERSEMRGHFPGCRFAPSGLRRDAK
jgi:hypothetical protein